MAEDQLHRKRLRIPILIGSLAVLSGVAAWITLLRLWAGRVYLRRLLSPIRRYVTAKLYDYVAFPVF